VLNAISILDEKDKRLRKISQPVVFPLTSQDKELIKKMAAYLKSSQIKEIAKKYQLRPGMGLAASQLGINKRYFVIVHEEEEQKFKEYIMINPTIVSYSEEQIYAIDGEGCLSVNREVAGVVPRYARVTITGFNMEGKKITIRAREELAIAFQHEIDHLDGILFIDKVINPLEASSSMRGI